MLRELGADRVIDYRSEPFEDVAGEVDLVFDLIGGDTQDRSWRVLKQGGTMVSTLEEPSEDKAQAKGASTARFLVQPNGIQLAEIGRLAVAGRLRPVVAQTFPLDGAAAAQDRLEQEHSRGKIVLDVA